MSLYFSQQGHGEALVLLHGWGMNSAVWESLLPYLETQFRVISVDLPGHGHSTVFETADDHCDAVLSVWLDAFADILPERFYLCGWSLGGMLALAIQQRWPERVQGIVMLTAAPRFVADLHWQGTPYDQLESFADQLLENTNQTLFQFFALQFLGVENGRQQMRDALQSLAAQGQASHIGLEQGLLLLRGLDLRDVFSRIGDARPLAVLLGKQDKLVSAKLQSAIQALNSAADVQVWPKVGHAPHLAQPQRVADFIAEVLL